VPTAEVDPQASSEQSSSEKRPWASLQDDLPTIGK